MLWVSSVGQQSGTFPRDRRERPRAGLRAPVLVDLVSRWEQAVCHDVSPDGIGVELTDPLPLGARVEIYFELPTWHAVEAQAEVVRSHDGITGLRFLDLDAATARALAAYCDDMERADVATAVVSRLALPDAVQVTRPTCARGPR